MQQNGKNILHVTVENRCKNVFKLVSQMNQHRHYIVTSVDSSNNTMLHLAGKLSDENELNCTFGEALLMQEELRWFEVIKSISLLLTIKVNMLSSKSLLDLQVQIVCLD